MSAVEVKEPRPEWATVARLADQGEPEGIPSARHRELISAITAAGFTTTPVPHRDRWHYIHFGDRLMGRMFVNASGAFASGWIEYVDGQGRYDARTSAEFLTVLEAFAAESKRRAR